MSPRSMTYLSLLARLLYDPPHAISALRAARPPVPALLAASFATIGYFALLSGLAQDLIGIARVQGAESPPPGRLSGSSRHLHGRV